MDTHILPQTLMVQPRVQLASQIIWFMLLEHHAFGWQWFLLYQGLNPGPYTCRARALPLSCIFSSSTVNKSYSAGTSAVCSLPCLRAVFITVTGEVKTEPFKSIWRRAKGNCNPHGCVGRDSSKFIPLAADIESTHTRTHTHTNAVALTPVCYKLDFF